MNNNTCGGFADGFSEIAKIFDANTIQTTTTMAGELTALNALITLLPTAINAACQCQEIIDDYEDKKEKKYSKKQYLTAIHQMYESGQITGEQAMKASEIIFKSGDTVEVKPNPVTQKIQEMIDIL